MSWWFSNSGEASGSETTAIRMSGRQDFSAPRHGVIRTVSPIDLSRIRRTLLICAQSRPEKTQALELRPGGGWLILDHRFVNEHHRYVVVYWVHALALRAFQPCTIRLELNLYLTNRAGENFEKSRAYRHVSPPILMAASLTSALCDVNFCGARDRSLQRH